MPTLPPLGVDRSRGGCLVTKPRPPGPPPVHTLPTGDTALAVLVHVACLDAAVRVGNEADIRAALAALLHVWRARTGGLC
jgi:hypothetical protein